MDDYIERYWNDIQDWSILATNPVKTQMDKIFMKFFIFVEKEGFRVRTRVELADITDPYSYVVEAKNGDMDASFTVHIEGIHDRYMFDVTNEYEYPYFNEDKANKWRAENDTFSIEIRYVDFGYAKIKDLDAYNLDKRQLIVFANSLMNKKPQEYFERINNLDSADFESELYVITGDEEYLPQNIKDIFLF